MVAALRAAASRLFSRDAVIRYAIIIDMLFDTPLRH